jgi:hypothetical protein
MKTRIALLALPFAAALTLGPAYAQSPDAAYCKALTDKYTTYVHDKDSHRPMPSNAGIDTAIAKCQAGDTAAGIPVLEKALTNAQVALPSRG